mmetsp:Transcript_2793/g.2955  ORF Transcript_2793/g.2955 Transcript_2793/m.2955 type:complete len:118 (+) Transcript_2793:110-463(+)|eukprot:CAMPEP_0182418736 /NCGR_PEP_ID=MMETSP1167-20130531/3106_1 /TAXON_ID=2988 /ORGANISM="Mallomonas Sp, Strain CCMP3275" /LENGTH=117 /DNA_ID=CAMNT_0024593083 /DNA_START=83 /DNA_END=436 /DNA_ORIENTATION=-
MREIAAYLLCVLGGSETPSTEQVSKVITACGGEVDDERLKSLLSDIEGKDIAELLAKGKEDLKDCSAGGGGGPAAPVAAADATAAVVAPPAAPKEEEVDALDGGMDMFGGSGGGGDY